MLTTLSFEDQFAIEKTVVWFFKFLDARAYEDMWALMAADGYWDRSGRMLDSRETFLAAMAERPEHLVIRHLPINVGVAHFVNGIADASFDLLLYRHIGEVPEGPAPLEGVKAITHWTTSMAKAGETWKMKSLDFEVLMHRA
jgi:hypothetical protein